MHCAEAILIDSLAKAHPKTSSILVRHELAGNGSCATSRVPCLFLQRRHFLYSRGCNAAVSSRTVKSTDFSVPTTKPLRVTLASIPICQWQCCELTRFSLAGQFLIELHLLRHTDMHELMNLVIWTLYRAALGIPGFWD